MWSARPTTGIVEAVGIEPASDRLVSYDSVAITQDVGHGETRLNPGESELRDQPGTRVPNANGSDALLAHVLRAWGALRAI
jgi:hypothetical protein